LSVRGNLWSKIVKNHVLFLIQRNSCRQPEYIDVGVPGGRRVCGIIFALIKGGGFFQNKTDNQYGCKETM
jgi:hypothetical protein